jgi:ATP-dependent DNA helicase RecQ
MLRDLSESLTINEGQLRDRRQREFDKLDTMIEYTRSACRRRYLLEYFGQVAPYERCGTCDGCRGDTPDREIPQALDPEQEVVVRKALACIARMSQGRTVDSQNWSPGLIVKVLTGSQNQTVKSFRFQKLSTYGILSDWTQKEVQELLGEMVRAGALRKHHVTREVGGRERTYAEIGLSDVGVAVMLQRTQDLEKDFEMVFPQRGRAAKAAKAKKSRRKRGSRASGRDRAASSASSAADVDTDLLRELKGIRSTLARDGDVPAYVIAPNRALEDMASVRPTTRQAMLDVHGMGPSRVRKYGASFLEVIREWGG